MEPTSQSGVQVGEFALAFLLSGLVGSERERRRRDAGLRTYTVVGIGSALRMLISEYGFADVLAKGTVVLDPSRVAAQIVSGLEFIRKRCGVEPTVRPTAGSAVRTQLSATARGDVVRGLLAGAPAPC
jgi:hypothetical protein